MSEIVDFEAQDARRYHLKFMQATWAKKSEPMLVGRHTLGICAEIDAAIENLRKGQSTFLIIKVPFRHGKSDIVSRYLPPHFVGLFPDSEVMLVTYAGHLAAKFSRFARGIMRTPAYQKVFPGVTVSNESSAADLWAIQGRLGSVAAASLNAGMTGNGYHLGILDDYCGSRADAESASYREKTWDAFTNDFLTRRAPAAITIVLATPWHVDDIIGRAEKAMHEDPEFPRFKVVRYPGLDPSYPTGYLFPERFSAGWYNSQKATLGHYGFASLMQCDPQVRKGNLLNANNVVTHDSLAEYPKDIVYVRMWDLAHTAKQRMKDDPDWTSGTLLGFKKVGDRWEAWIKDVFRIRAPAPERDREIKRVTLADGPSVRCAIEKSIDSRDTYETMKEILMGIRTVNMAEVSGDKVVRATPLEPLFEAGNVHVPAGAPWLYDWQAEVSNFPSWPHDDMVDNLSAGYQYCTNGAVPDDVAAMLSGMKVYG